MKYFYRYLCWMAWALLTLAACVRELPEPVSGGDPFPEGGQVTITFSVPDFEGTVDTKAIGDGGSLQTLHVAVFGSSGYLKEYIKAIKLEETPRQFEYKDPYYSDDMSDEDKRAHTKLVNLIKFSATLSLSEKSRIIHFVGNGPATLPYDADTTVMTTLMSEGGNGGFWQIRRVSYIGALKDEQGHYINKKGERITDGKGYVPDEYTEGQFNNIPLVRNWAKISLITATTDFELESFAVVNVPSKGTIAPIMKGQEGNLRFVEGYETRTFEYLQSIEKYPANLPDEAIFNEDIPKPTNFIAYDNGNGVAFLYERPIPNEHLKATYVIVYGKFVGLHGDGNKYYYKIDLAQDGFYYPIYRNFDYQIRITNVGSKGFTTPQGAAEAVGGVDISADVSTHHLGDISDGKFQLSVRPWMAHSFHMQQTDNDILSVKFFDDITGTTPVVNMKYQDSIDVGTGKKVMKKIGEEYVYVISNIPDPDKNPISWEILPAEDNLGDVIENVFIGHPYVDASEGPEEAWDDGWRKIYFSTIAPETGMQSRTQTLRIKASYRENELPRVLYRDIQITVLPQQHMKLRCEKPELEDETGAEQTLTILIPEGLPSSMFPLDFTIEPEEMTLMPKTGTNMPVVYGTSIAVPSTNKPTGTFQFVRSVTYTEYTDSSIISEKDASDGSMWRPFTSQFVSTRTENATRIWVANDNFETNSTAFENASKRFRNVTIPSFELIDVANPGYKFPVSFDVEESYKYGFPEITLVAKGITVEGGLPDDAIVTSTVDGGVRYVYTPSQNTQNLVLKTSISITETEGNFSLDISARPDDHYTSTTIALRRFTDCRFRDGIWSKGVSLYSNVMFEYVTTDARSNGKAAPFGYRDDKDFPAVVTLKEVGTDKAFTYLNYPGNSSTGVPTVDNFPLTDVTYHEIPFRTRDGKTDPLSFRMVAPSYLTKTITAGRFSGGQAIGNYGSVPVDNSKFKNKTKETFSYTNECKVEVDFSKVTVENGNLILAKTSTDATESFTMEVKSATSGNKPLYYVEITFVDGSNVPDMSVDVGTISRYWGYKDAPALQYIWNFPVSHSTVVSDPNVHTLTFTSSDDVKISKIIIRGIGLPSGASFIDYTQP